MAKEYLTVDGKLVMSDGKLVQVPDADNLNDLADENEAYATQGVSLTDDIEELIVNGIVDGSPRDVYDNLEALKTAYPSGTSGVYLTKDSGHWYYWNGSAWTDGGVYQAVQSDTNIINIEDNITTIYQLVNYLNENTFNFQNYQDKNLMFKSFSIDENVYYKFNAIITTTGTSGVDNKATIICKDGVYSLTASLTDDGLVYSYDIVSKTKHVKIIDDIVDVTTFINYINESYYNMYYYNSNIVIFESIESESGWIWHTFVFIPAKIGSSECGILICDGNMYRLTGTSGKYQVEKYLTESDSLSGISTNALTPTIVDELPTTGEVNKLYIKRVSNTTQNATFTYDGHTFKVPEIPEGHYLTIIGDNTDMQVQINGVSEAIDLNTYYLCCVSKNGTIYTYYNGNKQFGGEPDVGEYITIDPNTTNIKWYKINKTNVETNEWELVIENKSAYYNFLNEKTKSVFVSATTCPHGTGAWTFSQTASAEFSRESTQYTNYAIGSSDVSYGDSTLKLINLISNSFTYEYYLMDGEDIYQITTNNELNKAINSLKTEMNTKLGDIETLLSEV